MKKVLIYIFFIIFLIASISYAEDNVCILKKNSVITVTLGDMLLFKLFVELKEIDIIDYMYKVGRLGVVPKDEEVKILKIYESKKDGLHIFEIEAVKDQYKMYVLYYNVKCNGDEEENDKTKRKTPKRQEKERKNFKERTKGRDVEA